MCTVNNNLETTVFTLTLKRNKKLQKLIKIPADLNSMKFFLRKSMKDDFFGVVKGFCLSGAQMGSIREKTSKNLVTLPL